VSVVSVTDDVVSDEGPITTEPANDDDTTLMYCEAPLSVAPVNDNTPIVVPVMEK